MDEAESADEPAGPPVDSGLVVEMEPGRPERAEEAGRLGARLEETLMANSLLWVDIHEGSGGRSDGALAGSFQPEITDDFCLRLIRTDGNAFAEWDLQDFELSLADGDVFGHRVVLTGQDAETYSFPALPQEDAERLLRILSEAREAASRGPAHGSEA